MTIEGVSTVNLKIRVFTPFFLLVISLFQCSVDNFDKIEEIRNELAKNRAQCFTSEKMVLVNTIANQNLDYQKTRGLLLQMFYLLGNNLNQVQIKEYQKCFLRDFKSKNCKKIASEVANLALKDGHICQNVESHDDDHVVGSPSIPASNPSGGSPSNPASNPNGGSPSNPASNPSGGSPSNPASNPNGGSPSNPASNPNGGSPSNPASNPSGGSPSIPASNPSGGSPSNPASNPSGGSPSNPASNPSGGSPSNPASNPSGGSPSIPASNPSGGSPSNPASNPNGGSPSNPASNPNGGSPSNPASNPSGGSPSNPASNPNGGSPSNPASNPSGGSPSIPASNPSGGSPSNPASNPNGGSPSIVHPINNFNPRTTPGGGYIPILSPTPPTSSPAPGGGSAISLPSGNVIIPSDPAQRRQLLENSYEDVEIPANVDPGPAVPISPRVSPDTLDASATSYQTFRYLLDPELRLTTSGNIPYLKPLEPDVYTHETNSYNDPAFSSLSTWNKNYWYARFNSGTNGHVLYLLDYTYGRNRIGNLASTDSKVYIKQDELYIGYPYTDQQNRNQANNLFDSTKLIDISALNLPIRRINTVTIANPLPTLASSSVSPCNKSVTGKGTRVAPFKIYNFKQFNNYLRRYLTSYFTIECDIDASSSRSQNNGAGFEPIRYFAGFVNGNGHRIVGLYINRPDEYQVGLFAQLLGSKIENLTITNARVTGKYQVGILAGHMVRSLVDSVKATGHVQGVGETGGLIGFQTSHFFAYTHGIVYYKYNTVRLFVPYRTAEIKNSHVKILVNCVRGAEGRKFHRMCGGMVGWMGSGFINSSSASGNVVMSEAPVGNGVAVKIDGDMAGGLVGVIGTRTNDGGALLIEADGPFAGADVFRQARVYRSYSTVNIYAGITIGGLIGAALRGGVVIAESYAKNFHLEGESMLAGLVATLEGSYLVNCYAVNGTIYSHSEDPNDPIFTKIYASPSVYSFIGFSDSIFTNPASETLAITYQRVYARYLVSSRFKIGVANTYADVQVNNTSVTKSGFAIPFIRNVAGSYYRLNGSAIHVVGTVLDNHVRGRFPRNANNMSGYLVYSAYKPPYLNIADFWSGGKFVSTRAGDPSYGWRHSGMDSRHLVTHSSRKTLECPTAPNASCRGKKNTYVNWPASGVWNFGTNHELPTLLNVVSDPGLN